MIAILLAAVAMIGILALYMTQTRAGSFSRHTTEAAVLATDGLEQLRIAGVPASSTTASLDEQGKVVTGGLFTRTSTVTNVGTFYDITVRISWDEDGATRNVIVNARRNL